jgi:type II secretory pathway pseudopilin PulG
MNERKTVLESKLCGRCLKPVPVTFTAKDICRNCGNYWRSEADIKLEADQGKSTKNLSPFKLIIFVIVLGIITALIALGFIKFLNNQRLTESMAISSSLKVAFDDYADENKVYPDKIEDWSDIVYICNLNIKFKNEPLKTTAEAEGLKFIKYTAIDAGRSYMMRLEVRGIPRNTRGKIIEISPSGLKKLTGQELD